jgi:hypothetical protein
MAKLVGLLPSAPGIAGGFQGGRLTWDDEVMESIIAKAALNKSKIHGDKLQSSEATFWPDLSPEEQSFVTTLKTTCRSHGVEQFPEMEPWKLIDMMVLWGPPGTSFQQWHMDTWATDILIGTLLASGPTTPTELANIAYKPIDIPKKDIEATASAMKLPWDWTSILPIAPIKEWHAPKALIMFKGDAMHRGPAVPAGGPARVLIYFAWGPEGISTKRFVDNAVFNKLRVHTQQYPPIYTYVYVFLFQPELCLHFCLCVCVRSRVWLCRLCGGV